MLTRPRFLALVACALMVLAGGCSSLRGAGPNTLLNVSYDPTRELYHNYNAAFISDWHRKTGQTVTLVQSHSGSGKQARAVQNGLPADVVTLGISTDIDALAKSGLLAKDWAKRLPDNSAPYTSTVVFLVRRGNPKGIHDWPDLVKPGIAVITPSPKSSSGGRWSYLAAWGYALKQPGGSPETAKAFVGQLYKNVPILDPGARGSSITFTKHNVGDVLLAWENEADLALKQPGGAAKFEIVYPSISILAEPPVAVVDQNADAHGTRALATAYLQYLYSPEGQKIAAQNFYRPRLPAVAKLYAAQFPPIRLFTASEVVGEADAAQKTHFADGGVFDQIFVKK